MKVGFASLQVVGVSDLSEPGGLRKTLLRSPGYPLTSIIPPIRISSPANTICRLRPEYW
jgi:hypothetical protein